MQIQFISNVLASKRLTEILIMRFFWGNDILGTFCFNSQLNFFIKENSKKKTPKKFNKELNKIKPETTTNYLEASVENSIKIK